MRRLILLLLLMPWTVWGQDWLPDGWQGAPFLASQADYPDAFAAPARERNAIIKPAYVRHGWRSRWEQIEANGYAPLDKIIALNQGKKIILMAVCDNSRVNTNGFNDLFIADYLVPMVTRYKDQIWAVEIWNEPSLDLFGGFAPAQQQALHDWLTDLIVKSAAAVRAINPSIKIIAPAWADFRNWNTERMTEAWKHVDGFSWHYYDLAATAPDSDQWTPGNLYGYTGECKGGRVDDGARLMRALVGEDKLLVVDELGLYGARVGQETNIVRNAKRSNLTTSRGAARAAKALILYRAAGVEVILPHQFDAQSLAHDPLDEWPCWEIDGSPAPKTIAIIKAAHELRDATFIRSEIGATSETHYFDTVTVTWQRENDAEIGELPVYSRLIVEPPCPVVTFTNTVEVVTYTTNYFDVWQTNTVTQVVPCPSVKTTMVTRAELESIPGIGRTLGQRVKDRLDNWGYRR